MPKGMQLGSRKARLCDFSGGSHYNCAIPVVRRKVDEAVGSAQIFTKEEAWAYLKAKGLNYPRYKMGRILKGRGVP